MLCSCRKLSDFKVMHRLVDKHFKFDEDGQVTWMKQMVIKRRHDDGCMWPSKGCSLAVVVSELHTGWVTRISHFLYLSMLSVLVTPIAYLFFNRTVLCADTTSLDLQGPIFVHEPAYKIEFSNSTGGHIHCSGHANPYPEVRHDSCMLSQSVLVACKYFLNSSSS